MSLVELKELELLDKETLNECVSAKETRAEGDLPEVAQCNDTGVRVDLIMSEPLVLKAFCFLEFARGMSMLSGPRS